MVDFGNVKGLQSALENPFKSNVSTIYNYENSEKTWQLIEKFKGEGGAIFTQPQGIIKCAGGMSLYTCSSIRISRDGKIGAKMIQS